MSETVATLLRKSPLDSTHRALNARMISFAGWDMPLEYSGITDEHLAVRSRVGLFDVSHMGEIEVAGKDALAAVQRISCNDASVLRVGQAHYSGLLTTDGTFVDDVLVYRLAATHFLLVVNAANTAKDYAWISEQIKSVGEAAAIDSSSRYALISVQGPASVEVLQSLTGVELDDLRYYRFAYGEVASARAMISRYWVFWRRRVRDLRSAEHGGACVAGLDGVGPTCRHRSLWARRTRHAEARGRHAPVRQRHRRIHHRARSRSRLDCRVE